MINKFSNLPIYVQIEQFLSDEIDRGTYESGELIPSERELSERFQVSRMTVRQAINNLVSKGKLYREKGKGTFVAERRLSYELKGLVSFTEDMRRRGLTPSARLLSFEIVKSVHPSILDLLKLDTHDKVYCLHRVRYADGEPLAVEKAYVPYKLFSSMTEEDVKGSLYDYVRRELKEDIHHASQQIEADLATDEESRYLQIKEHNPVLIVKRTTYLTSGHPFEYVKTVFRGEKYSFFVNVFKN